MRAHPAPAVTPAAISALVRGAVGAGPIQPVQPGQLIRAIVLSVADDGLLSIAMPGGRTVAARTDVPVRPGAQVEVAVEEGPQADGAAAPLRFIVRGAIAAAPPQAPAATAPPAADVQRAQAVAVAATTAAQGQAGIAPLMADLSQAMATQNPPAPVVAAARQLLARQTSVERPIAPGAVRQALSQSGLFMEQRLTGPAPAQAQPTDLKALLLVLHQAAKAWWRAAAAEPPVARPTSAAAAAASAAKPAPPSGAPQVAAVPAPGDDPAAATTASRPSPPALVTAPVAQSAGGALARPGQTQSAPLPGAPLADLPDPVARPAAQTAPAAAPPAGDPAATAPRPARAPPPYRGAPITAQPPATPTLAADTPAAAAARRIVQGTEAALARQDLLQIASLPDAPRTAAAEPASRWMFDMPLATPQGPAVAQFEISRDGGGGGGGGAGEAARIWRARFSIDIEPMGPVHAQLAMGDGRIAVALWAEREESLAALRLQEAELAHALGDGEHPAEVAIHPGAPRVSPAAAGRFLDVAS